MIERSDPDAYAAYRAALSQSGSLVGVMIVFLFADPFPWSSGVPFLRLGIALWNAVLLVALWLQRRQPRLWFCTVAFIVGVLPMALLFWVASVARQELAIEWEPLLREKFIFFTIALFAPPRIWIGTSLIAIFALEAGLEYWLGGVGNSPHLLHHEPWVTFAVAAVAQLLLVTRTRHQAREVALVRQVEKLSSAKRIARMALAVRDVANTPLQTLEIRVALLEKHTPVEEPTLGSIKRAVARLAALNERLKRFEPEDPSDDDALDSDELLQR